MEYSLSLENFQTLPFDKYGDHFTFIVNGKRYETSRITADLLSPTIRNYHYQDCTNNEFTINIKTNDGDNDYFKDFLQLCTFEQNQIDQSKLDYFCQYFILLGNTKEYLKIQNNIFDNITTENVLDKLIQLQKIFTNYQQNIDLPNELFESLIQYASEHFSELNKDKMKKIDKSIIELIIRKETLKLNEEDDLLKFILNLYEENNENSPLFEYIEFDKVSKEAFENFIESFSIEYLSLGIWKSICKRFLNYQNIMDYKRLNKSQPINMPYIKGQEFNGIIQFLTNKVGGNEHKNGTIKITSNSILTNISLPQNSIDYNTSSSYYQSSVDTENTELCFDFKENAIQVSNYSIESSCCNIHLKNWVMEVSNDRKNWVLIDEHINDPALKNNRISTFNTKLLNDFYRFARIRQTGKSWDDSYTFVFYKIELFGKLIENYNGNSKPNK